MVQENRSFDHYFGALNTYRVKTIKDGTPVAMTDVDTIDNPNVSGASCQAGVCSNPADDRADVVWSTSNATTVTFNGGPPPLQPFNPSPSTAAKFVVTATNTFGSTSASLVIGVTPDSGANVLVGASPETVSPGGTMMLSWAATDGTAVTISPVPDAKHPEPYGPHGRIPVQVPIIPGSYTYTVKSSNGQGSITITVAPANSSLPTASITDNQQGHVSRGAALNLASFLLNDQCVEDFSPDWLESHGAYNRDNPSSNQYLGNGFVHIAAGFAQFANSQGAPFHFFDVRGKRAMSHYDESILPYYYFMAAQFGTADRWFSPIPANSPASRLYNFAATSQGRAHNPTSQLTAKTIFEQLDQKGVSWKIYYSDVSANGQPNTTLTSFTYGSTPAAQSKLAPVDCNFVAPTGRGTPCAAGVTDYFTDLKNGTLPQVVLIEPGFDSGRDEHTGNEVQRGSAYVAKLINALMASSSWKDSVFVLVFDEAGGLYDHVRPVIGSDNSIGVSPDGIPPMDLIPGKDPTGDFDRTGFRIPVFFVSPFTRPHFVWHQPADNTAILKFIEKRFNLSALTKRDAVQPDMSEIFDFQNVPWKTPPAQNLVPAQPGQPGDPGWAPCFGPNRPF
jgi:phospholipase C